MLTCFSADLWGATEHLCHPYFSESSGLPNLSLRDMNQSSAQTLLLKLLDTLPLSPGLLISLVYMRVISERISEVSSSPTLYTEAEQIFLMKDIYSLRYSLVSSPTYPPGDPNNASLDDVLRIGAILYLQATPQEFPYAAVGPGNLVKKLRSLVFKVHMWNEREAELVMWLLFIGAMCAKRGPDRIWYIAQIEKLARRLGFKTWNVVKEKLEMFWWVSGLHQKATKEVWDEVEVLSNVMSR
jgi:Fungal specific transcription factor domain